MPAGLGLVASPQRRNARRIVPIIVWYDPTTIVEDLPSSRGFFSEPFRSRPRRGAFGYSTFVIPEIVVEALPEGFSFFTNPRRRNLRLGFVERLFFDPSEAVAGPQPAFGGWIHVPRRHRAQSKVDFAMGSTSMLFHAPKFELMQGALYRRSGPPRREFKEIDGELA